MRNDQRQFYVYDLEIAARKDGATVPNMDEVVAVWQKTSQAGKALAIQANSATALIGQVQSNQQQRYATLLLRLSDKTTPNSVYSDPSTNHFHEHVKVGNQGADFACHVLVSLDPENGIPNIYTCAVERVPGLSAPIVQRVLSKMLNIEFNENSSFYLYPSPGGGLTRGGQPRMERCCPHIELRGRPSDSLIADINAGHISGVALVKTETATPISGAPYLVRKQSELALSINHQSLPANIWQGLTQVFRAQASQYPTAKVSYRVPGTKRTVTVDINSTDGTPLRDLYIEFFELNAISPILSQSSQVIVSHLRDLALPQFLARRNV